jgi:hypothetical protein
MKILKCIALADMGGLFLDSKYSMKYSFNNNKNPITLQDLFSTHTNGGHFHPLLASFNTLQFTSGKLFHADIEGTVQRDGCG